METQSTRLACDLYLDDLDRVSHNAALSILDGATVLVSGATGMVGTFLVDLLMKAVDEGEVDCRVVSVGRSEAKARKRLPYFTSNRFSFEELDISQMGISPKSNADFVFHLASTTHPRAYATQPIGTITSNVNGLQNLLEHAGKTASSRFVFASSVEVYGENRGDVESFKESYLGFLNCDTLRAGYPEAKRLGETLCHAYASERGQEVYVPRLPRIIGPTVLPTDSKAISQFIHNAVMGEDIVLKSSGTQTYSYLYVADVVSGLLWLLSNNLSGKAYNLAHDSMNASLRELANQLADAVGSKVVFEHPDEIERAGYSVATRATMDGSALASTGWHPLYQLDDSLIRTVRIIQEFKRGR